MSCSSRSIISNVSILCFYAVGSHKAGRRIIYIWNSIWFQSNNRDFRHFTEDVILQLFWGFFSNAVHSKLFKCVCFFAHCIKPTPLDQPNSSSLTLSDFHSSISPFPKNHHFYLFMKKYIVLHFKTWHSDKSYCRSS